MTVKCPVNPKKARSARRIAVHRKAGLPPVPTDREGTFQNRSRRGGWSGLLARVVGIGDLGLLVSDVGLEVTKLRVRSPSFFDF